MKIGIVGTGNLGATLARQLASLGNDIGVANSRGPETRRWTVLTGIAPS
jgi:8-hydroxy-5-deazaflavin:NADPH oxidoreductase